MKCKLTVHISIPNPSSRYFQPQRGKVVVARKISGSKLRFNPRESQRKRAKQSHSLTWTFYRCLFPECGMSLSEAKVRTSQPQDGRGMNFVIKYKTSEAEGDIKRCPSNHLQHDFRQACCWVPVTRSIFTEIFMASQGHMLPTISTAAGPSIVLRQACPPPPPKKKEFVRREL